MKREEMDALRRHVTDHASLNDYLAMGYRLEEGDPFWLLYDQDDAPYATVDRALAEWYAKWIRAMDRIGI